MTVYIPILVAVISAAVSLIVALLSIRTQRNLESTKADLAARLETIKTELAEKAAEKNARRDYEYEARKHLYHEYEPLLFQLVELAESAFYKVASLAKDAKEGNLNPGQGWLSGEGYYTLALMYRLIAPLVVVSIIQRQLTYTDLTLDPEINAQYTLAKYLYLSYSDDFDFAQRVLPLPYDPEPDSEDWEIWRQRYPQEYWKQGIARGWLDDAVNALTVSESTGLAHCMRFGQFQAAYSRSDGEMRTRFSAIADIFIDFHPKTRPVLWRMLITHAHMYRALMQTREIKLSSSNKTAVPWKAIAEAERRNFDWRQSEDEATDEEVLALPFKVADAYLHGKLEEMFSYATAHMS